MSKVFVVALAFSNGYGSVWKGGFKSMTPKRFSLFSVLVAMALRLPSSLGQDPVSADPKHYALDTDHKQVSALGIRLGPSTGSFENTSGGKTDFLYAQLKQPGLPPSNQSTAAVVKTPGSPRYDLTGIWYRASADTSNDQSDLEFSITRDGDSLFATKTTSSIYIPAGQVVCQGTLISDSIIAGKVQRALEGYVNRSWVDVIIDVRDGGNRMSVRGAGINWELLRK